MLGTDSAEYDLLQRAVIATQMVNVNALSVEIGLRAGGGTRLILDALAESEQWGRTHIAIDPWGNIEYLTAENTATRHDYTNEMRNLCLSELYQYVREKFNNGLNVLVFPLEDSEFFARYADGVPIYQEYKRLATTYSFVHFDGPHALAPITAEIDFFLDRTEVGGAWVFDDIDTYDHDAVERYIFERGFALLEKGSRKGSYQKFTDIHSRG